MLRYRYIIAVQPLSQAHLRRASFITVTSFGTPAILGEGEVTKRNYGVYMGDYRFHFQGGYHMIRYKHPDKVKYSIRYYITNDYFWCSLVFRLATTTLTIPLFL